MTPGESPNLSRRRNFALAHVYFDTCCYVAGALETLPEVRAHSNYQDMVAGLTEKRSKHPRRESEEAMTILLSRWNPELAFVSYHTLLEAIDVATRRYDLPVERVLDIIVSGIGHDFTLLPAEVEMVDPAREIIERLEQKLSNRSELARVRVRAMARDEAGRELGMVGLGAGLTTGAGTMETTSGSPETFRTMKSLDPPQSHTISDHKFERELLLGAAQVAVQYGVHAADALHVLRCMNKGMVLVTSDDKLLKRFPKMTGQMPAARTPQKVLELYGRMLDPPISWPRENDTLQPIAVEGRANFLRP